MLDHLPLVLKVVWAEGVYIYESGDATNHFGRIRTLREVDWVNPGGGGRFLHLEAMVFKQRFRKGVPQRIPRIDYKFGIVKFNVWIRHGTR